MRIIGGKYRGRRIKQPGTGAVRPTKDRIRESVFNLVAEYVSGSALDLFAGSGAYGLEAISRGADICVFVDNKKAAVETINENIRVLGLEDRTEVVKMDAFAFIEKAEKEKRLFNIVFSDPPFKLDLAKKTLISIINYDILTRPGFLVLEHHVAERLPDVSGDVSLFKQKTYKDIQISVFLKK